MMLFSALWNYIKPPPNYQDLKIREIRLTLNCVCVYMGACLCMCAGTYVRLDQPLVSLLKISLPSFWDNLFGAYTFVKAGWPGSCVMSLLCLSRSGVASAHHCEHFSCEHWAWTQVFLCGMCLLAELSPSPWSEILINSVSLCIRVQNTSLFKEGSITWTWEEPN